jgi:pilus assembly protein CpaD
VTVSVRETKSLIVRAGAFALALAAAACAYPENPWDAPLPHDRFPITVRETRSVVEIPVGAETFLPSYDEIAQIRGLGRAYLDAGRGPIIIAQPIGGGNDEAAVEVGARVRDELAALGIDYAAIRGVAYDAQGRSDAPLVVMVDRFVAEAADCHREWRDFSRTSNGENTFNFGCAFQANLAAIVTDPADLIGPRDQSYPDAGRRSVVLGRYREGETTITQRDADEGTQVSDAVQ